MVNRFSLSIICFIYFFINAIPLFLDGFTLSGFNSLTLGTVTALLILQIDVLVIGGYICLLLGLGSLAFEVFPEIYENSKLYSEAVFTIIERMDSTDSDILSKCATQMHKDVIITLLESIKVIYFNLLMSAQELFLSNFREPIPNQCMDALNTLKQVEPQFFSELSDEANEILFINSK